MTKAMVKAGATGGPSIAIGAIHRFTETTGVQNQNFNQVGVTLTSPLFTGFNASYGIRQVIMPASAPSSMC